jgi:hypothetical protein
MNDKLVIVAYFADYIEAELAKQLLEDEGIVAFVMGQHGSAVYVGVPGIADIQLQTPESQADEARKILEASKQQKGKESEQETEKDVEQDWDEDKDGDDIEEQE